MTSDLTSDDLAVVATTVAEPHILVVTGDNFDGVDERTFRIEHVGPVVDCVMWVYCPPDMPCHQQGEDHDLEKSTTAQFHGVEHAWIFETGWCVRSDPAECFYASPLVTDQLQDLAVDLELAHQPGQMPTPLYAGRYAITPEYEGDGEFDVTVDRRIPSRVRLIGGVFYTDAPDGSVYVGRRSPYRPGSRWATPFKVGRPTPAMVNIGGRTRPMVATLAGAVPATPAAAVAWFDLMIEVFGLADQIRAELAGRDLACECPPEWLCHADVLLRVANRG